MDPIPLGLCQCGCGQPTQLATKTSAAMGRVKGQPLAYVQSSCCSIRCKTYVRPSTRVGAAV